MEIYQTDGKIVIWRVEDTNHLLNIIQTRFDDFYNYKYKKIVLWPLISKDMKSRGCNYTSTDCKKRWLALKNSYINILSSNIEGDFAVSMSYFECLHQLLGPEFDPLDMRGKCLKKMKSSSDVIEVDENCSGTSKTSSIERIDWDEHDVELFINLIYECQTNRRKERILSDEFWMHINAEMNLAGSSVTTKELKVKWLNFIQDFNLIQKTVKSSAFYSWTHFDKFQFIFENISKDLIKEDFAEFSNFYQSHVDLDIKKIYKNFKMRSTQNKTLRSKNMSNEPDSMETLLQKLEEKLNLEFRMKEIEKKYETFETLLVTSDHINHMLSGMLSNLKGLNNSCKHFYTNSISDIINDTNLLKDSEIPNQMECFDGT